MRRAKNDYTNPTRQRGLRSPAKPCHSTPVMLSYATRMYSAEGVPRWRFVLVWGDGVMSQRPNEPPMPDPLGYFLTWATYGTWLPGDGRGWIEYRHGWKLPDPIRKLEAEARMTEDACILHPEQRELVEKTIADHCQIRGWELHTVNCRTNHLHVVVSANRHPDVIRKQLKAWCTRRLKELERGRKEAEAEPRWRESGGGPRWRVGLVRENWWAERGSKRYINDEDSLEAAIMYVKEGQDRPR